MKIIHASMPADNPKLVAEILADMMSGEAMPFPPGGPDSWMAWAGDGSMEFEIVRRGHLMHLDPVEAAWHPAQAPQRLSEVHFAIGVDRPAAEIVEIAERAGWPVRLCSRGEGLFDLVEVWVEGVFLLEMLDPAQQKRYEEVVTPAGWKQFLAQAA